MPTPIYPQTEFAKFLLDKIYESGKTRKQFAKDVGTTPQTINGFVKGGRCPNYYTLHKFADALNVDVNYLIELVNKDR